MSSEKSSYYKYSSTFGVNQSNEGNQPNNGNTFVDQHSNIYSEDSNFYWKTNYYFNFNTSFFRFTAPSQIYDEIQLYCLKEHKQVIAHVLKDLQKSIQVSDCCLNFLNEPCFVIKNSHFADRFFDQLIFQKVFQPPEAQQFREQIAKQIEWKKLCIELMEANSKLFYWQLSYLFYLSIKLVMQIHTSIKKSSFQLQDILEKYLEQQLQNIRQRVELIRNSANLQIDVKKIMLTMMLGLGGIFINKFYDPKLQHLIQQNMAKSSYNYKSKKMIVVTSSKYRLERKLLFEQATNKRIKTSSNSV